MTETANKVFVLIVVLVVILTAFLTWKVSEWQNERDDSQTASAATYNTPTVNGGKVNINLVPLKSSEAG